ncbi:hypothetical protein AGDE_16716 [Angomonas deanei]|uniref:AAA domain containing protein, putative n=1 Tax=Angomonas deanei TaxID=59799 RepID=A0A7G2CGN5_9TRYP|nr:hypothetical protein AGDE_16716 [Angomonas deanei]CAD2218207.1 AAA domain containing protein, putative [Angomonas deanei]|eukprot:EPY16555.1 hypothetical protein AGDE_16716 [Angomonas deanei]
MDFNDENEWFDVKKEYEQFQLETTSETNNNNNHQNHESTFNNSDAVVRVLHQTNDSYMHTNTVTVMEDSDLNCISPIPLQGDRRQPQDHSLSEDENNIHNHHTITVSYSEEEKPSDIPPNSDDEDTSSIIMTNINHNNDSATPADMVNLLTLNEENFTPSEIQNINIKNKSRTRSPPPSSPVHHTQDMHRYHTVMRSISPATTLTEEYSHIPLPQVYEALNSRHRIFKLCLTGGPCGGKSSLLTQLQHNFFDRSGYRVMCVPEAATLLVSGGMQWDASLVREQQLILIKTQLLLEDRFYELAALSGVPTLIVSDRGTMDGRAFCSDEDFNFILNELGCTLEVLRDRYDGVLHVVSAAVGAEAYYNNDNTARYEDVEGARLSDLKLRQAYVGHAQLRLLENKKGESFTDKIENGFQMIERMVKGEEIDTEDENNQNNTSRTSHVVLKKNITLEEMREALSSDTAEHTTAIASYKEYHTILMNSDMKEVRLVVKRVMPDGSALHLFNRFPSKKIIIILIIKNKKWSGRSGLAVKNTKVFYCTRMFRVKW